jgi:hypothetical protein
MNRFSFYFNLPDFYVPDVINVNYSFSGRFLRPGYPLIRLQALRSWPVSAAIPNAKTQLMSLRGGTTKQSHTIQGGYASVRLPRSARNDIKFDLQIKLYPLG